MRLLKYFFLLLLPVLISCTKNETSPQQQNIQSIEELQGEWKSEYQEGAEFAGRKYNFRFECNTFKAVINNFTDAIPVTGPCAFKSNWTEYAAGTFNVKDGLVTFQGNYTDSLFQPITAEICSERGEYHFVYTSEINGKDVLLKYISGNSYYDINLQKIADFTCTEEPK